LLPLMKLLRHGVRARFGGGEVERNQQLVGCGHGSWSLREGHKRLLHLKSGSSNRSIQAGPPMVNTLLKKDVTRIGALFVG
jgi:hypothetical protein